MEPLFIDGIAAEDPAYNNIRDSENSFCVKGKNLTEKLWRIYQPFADKHFISDIQRDFNARFWEMYLTCTLLEHRLPVSCPKPGPDILVDQKGHRIWIEATAPTRGKPGLPDTVPEIQMGVCQDTPIDKIMLRFRSAIYEKFNKGYFDNVNNGIISDADSYIVAINGCRIPSSIFANDGIPLIVKAVFGIGPMEIPFNRKTDEWGKPRWSYRDAIEKGGKRNISISIFLDKEYENLSAIIFSHVDAGSLLDKMGKDFLVIHNPLAKNSLPDGFLKVGREWHGKLNEEDFELSYKDWS